VIRSRLFVAAAALAAMTASASAADDADYWGGAYFTPILGWGWGTASYEFATDGYYNDNIGDTFVQPLSSTPQGAAIGYNWRSGSFVWGLEAFFHSHGVAAQTSCMKLYPQPPPGLPCGDTPFDPDQEWDFKGHWFTGISARAGWATGRLLLYAQAGPVLGHLVSRFEDTDADYYIWAAKSLLGVSAEVGAQVALTPRFSIGIGYQVMAMAPFRVNSESYSPADFGGGGVPSDPGTPQGPATASDHTISYTSQILFARLTYRYGQGAPERRNIEPFDWSGSSWGIYVGALWQIGLQYSRDYTFGDHYLAGFSVQTSLNVCCGYAFEAGLSARLGYIWRDDILFYAEAGAAFHTGTFFNIIDGSYYSAGAGVEIALTPRMSVFMEGKAVGAPGLGFIEGNFQGGFNFWLGRR
jgi:opacity protein-like surface antigen